MDTKVKILGIYQRQGAKFFNTKTGLKLVLGTRKTTSIRKPANYLLEQVGRRFNYISSLYDLGSNEYLLDYAGMKLICTIDSEQAIIKPKEI